MIDKLKRNRFARKVLLLVLGFLSLLNQIIPKKQNQILFYDSGRDYLDDNTEAFFNWLKTNGYEKKYKFVVCVPKQKSRIPYLDYDPVGAFKGVLTYLTTKYVFFSVGDFRIRPSKHQIVVNQWHGTGTKKGGKQINDEGYQKERLDNFTYFIASSETTAPTMAEQFGCPMSKILIQGSARNDYLFSGKETLYLLGIRKEQYKKVFLWMPTFRNSKDDRFHDGKVSEETQLPMLYKYKDIEKFNAFLQSQNALVVIKAHPMSKLKNNNYHNIRIINNGDLISKGIKLYEFIKDFDALITDYSSVFPDFLILNRPIGFTMDDYDEYEKTRGFFFDNFRAYMPGHHMYSIIDMERFVIDVLEEKDEYIEARKKVLPVFWKYTDNNNCKRLAESVGITL